MPSELQNRKLHTRVPRFHSTQYQVGGSTEIDNLLTGFSVKNGRGSEIDIFGVGRIEYLRAGNFQGFFHLASAKYRRVCYTMV